MNNPGKPVIPTVKCHYNIAIIIDKGNCLSAHTETCYVCNIKVAGAMLKYVKNDSLYMAVGLIYTR